MRDTTAPRRARRARGTIAAAGLLSRLAVVAGLVMQGVPCAAVAAEHQPRVMIISTGDTTLPAGTALTKGILAALATSPRPLEIYVEYLDAVRFPFDVASDRLARNIAEKYADIGRPDLVIAAGMEALQFATAHRGLFGDDRPIAFGVTGWDDAPPLTPPPNTAGVLGRVFIGRTLALASALQPDARRLVVVAGTAARDTLNLRKLREQLDPWRNRFAVTELVGLTGAELTEALGSAGRETIVFFLTSARDHLGNKIISADVASALARSIPAPVYSIYDTTVGRGVVGGYMERLESVGEQIGRVALRIMAGEKPEDIGVLESGASAALVDWRAFRRAGLDPSRLPAGTVILFRDPPLWEQYRPQILAVVLAFLVLSSLLVILLWERRWRAASEHSLRLLAGAVLAARDEERRRIARELHDSTGQNIAVASLMLGKLKDTLDDAARPGVDGIADVLKRIMQEIRTLSYVLHPPLLDEAGLRSALPQFVEEFSKRSGIAVALDVDAGLGRLPLDVELALFRVVQEGLTNVSRHSGSGTARIRLWREEDVSPPAVFLRIEDEGRGFPGTAREGRTLVELDRSGVGIAGMQERLRTFGGHLRIMSGAGSTILTAVVPLETSEVPEMG